MSDRERAAALLDRWHAAPGVEAGNLADWVAAELAAVRRDERGRIVAHLRAMAASRRRVRNLTPVDRAELFESVADMIERGEHGGAS